MIITCGVDHELIHVIKIKLTRVYKIQGQWKEAKKLQVRVIETSKVALGVDHPNTLIRIGNLASTCKEPGLVSGRRRRNWRQVVETRATKLGPDRPYTLSSMNNLTFTIKGQGRHVDAMALLCPNSAANPWARASRHAVE